MARLPFLVSCYSTRVDFEEPGSHVRMLYKYLPCDRRHAFQLVSTGKAAASETLITIGQGLTSLCKTIQRKSREANLRTCLTGEELVVRS